MRIIRAYHVANTLKYIMFFAFCTTPISAHDWTVYLYMQADGAYEEALQVVKDLKDELAHDKAMKVCVDIQGESSHRILFENGRVHARLLERSVNQLSLIKEGCDWAFENTSENTMLIISGHGTGILTPRYMNEGWAYEKDSGLSPCKSYCTRQYEVFCKQVTTIMNGKSLLTADKTTFLTADDLHEVMAYAHAVLGRQIDIVGFDSCYMAMVEIAYEVAPYARYMVASQESEEKDGWNYHDVITALRYADALEASRKLVYSYERSQRLRGADRFSLSVCDLSVVREVCVRLDRLVALCRSEKVLEALCAARTKLHKMSGIPMYADLNEFIEGFLIELDSRESFSLSAKIMRAGVGLLEQLHLLIPAVVTGSACTFLKGCSIYFPTAHIDTSYQAFFVQEHGWYDFLKFFTGNDDVVASKVVV